MSGSRRPKGGGGARKPGVRAAGRRKRPAGTKSRAPGRDAAGEAAPERLQKILARAGLGSRRSCEEIILDGRVQVNGAVVVELGTKADPSRDRITVDGRRVRAEPLVYYIVNKPKGAISTTAEGPDPAGDTRPAGRRRARRDRVVDLVPDEPRVVPVGRLDVDSEGLMLLTNDGALTHRLTHPSFGVERVYRADVKGEITDEAVARLRRGVRLAEGKTLPPKVRVVERTGARSGGGGGTLEVTIKEGLNREVRRMLAAVGLKVTRLVRTRLATLTLGKLRPGTYRDLGPGELETLREAVSGPPRKPPPWLRRKRKNRKRKRP